MYIAIGMMLGVFGDGLPYKDWIRIIISIIGVFMLIKNYSLIKRNRVIRILIVMIVLILLPTYIYYFVSHNATPESVRNLGDSIMWISVMILAYLIGYKGAPDKPCGEAVQTLTQNCCQTIHEEWYVFDSFHLCTEAFDL